MSKIMELADTYAEARGQEDINVVIATLEEFTKLYRARQEARAALAAEVEMMQADVENKADIAQRVIAERDALREKLAAVEKDAARYRWLTINAYVGIAPYPKPHEVWCLRLPNPSDCNNLDAAIDASMQGGQPNETT